MNNDSGSEITSAFEIFDTLLTNEQIINTIIKDCNEIKDIPFQFVGLGGPFTKVTGFKGAKFYHKRKVEGDIFENKMIEAEEILNEKVNNLGEVAFKEGISFKDIGLINDYYPIAKLENEVLKLAKNIASKSNLILKIGKKAFYKQLEMPLEKAYKYTSEVMTKNMMTLDANEGISAFLEKRTPKWKNK